MLFVIPTPIGNKDDITIRGLNLLKQLNIFISENTRTLKKLMSLYKIDFKNKQFFSLTSFTGKGKLLFYKKLVKEHNVGLTSEAGMPGLSDPGKELIKICWENNIKFEILPGSNALIPAVVGSCFDTSEFIFLGFLPKKKGRRKKIKYILDSHIPVFIYESVHRIEKTLLLIKELGFDGKVSIFRELTKIFEQKECNYINDILQKFKQTSIPIKGEFVIGFYNKKT